MGPPIRGVEALAPLPPNLYFVPKDCSLSASACHPLPPWICALVFPVTTLAAP